MTKDMILKDIQTLYLKALAAEKWSIALRAKEIQARIMGLFQHQGLPKIKRMSDLSDEDLKEFIDRLEATDPNLKA